MCSSDLQLTLTFVGSTELDIFGSSTKHRLSRRSLSGLHNTLESDMESLVSNRVGSNRESKNKSQQYSVFHQLTILRMAKRSRKKGASGDTAILDYRHEFVDSIHISSLGFMLVRVVTTFMITAAIHNNSSVLDGGVPNGSLGLTIDAFVSTTGIRIRKTTRFAN